MLDTVLSALQVFSPFVLTVSPWHQYCHQFHFSDETEAPAKSLALGHAAGRWPSWGSKPDDQATKLPTHQHILHFPGLWLTGIALTRGGPCHLRVWAEASSVSVQAAAGGAAGTAAVPLGFSWFWLLRRNERTRNSCRKPWNSRFQQWKIGENKKAECRSTDTFKLWCWRRPLRVPWTARRSIQWITEINAEYSLEELTLKLKLQYFGHLMQRAD